tara:strand:- start:414 stop:695 length:282 start_codon:yes stop_codon:yes gene_type:complete
MLKKRLEPEVRKTQILTKALDLATESHYMLVTQREIADALNISVSLILSYFGSMDELRYDIVQKAIDVDNQQVMSQAMTAGHKLAHTIPGGLK